MFTDPIQVTVSSAPDKFWGLTSTAWAAFASLIAAATTLVLLIFNWRYLRLVHQQSDAAMKQVELTTESIALTAESLEALKKQMADERERERHAALAVLGEATDTLELWGRRARMETRTDNSPIRLVPDDWSVLISYVSRRHPQSSANAFEVGRQLREAEVDLNRLVVTPINQRSGNNSVAALFESLFARLHRTFESIEALANALEL